MKVKKKSKEKPKSNVSNTVVAEPVKEKDIEQELDELRKDIEKLDEEPETEPEDTAEAPANPINPRKMRKRRLSDGTVEKKPAKAIDPHAETVTSKDIADSLGIESKVLRRTLRKLQEQGKISTRDGRWEWAAGSQDIVEIMKAFGK